MTVDKFKLDAIKIAYKNKKIKYEDIPITYKKYIEKLEENV